MGHATVNMTAMKIHEPMSLSFFGGCCRGGLGCSGWKPLSLSYSYAIRT